jgi:hypothetical protein
MFRSVGKSAPPNESQKLDSIQALPIVNSGSSATVKLEFRLASKAYQQLTEFRKLNSKIRSR